VHYHADPLRGGRVAGDHLVRYRAGKPPLPALRVEAEQMVAIGVGLADPQFADGAALRQRLLHYPSLLNTVRPPGRASIPKAVREWPANRLSYLYGALQQKSDSSSMREALTCENASLTKAYRSLLRSMVYSPEAPILQATRINLGLAYGLLPPIENAAPPPDG
jgi:hypothetical protein